MPEENQNYREMTAEFNDWEEQPVCLKFNFRKPSAKEVDRAVHEMNKAPVRGMRNLLLSVVQPEQKDDLRAALDEYPGLTGTYCEPILQSVGFAALGK